MNALVATIRASPEEGADSSRKPLPLHYRARLGERFIPDAEPVAHLVATMAAYYSSQLP